MADYSKLPPECDTICRWRTCLHKGENKGPYTPGRGYTSYYTKPEYVCMTRMNHGCGDNRTDFEALDTDKMLNDFEVQIAELKYPKKVRVLLLDMLTVIRYFTIRTKKENSE